MGVVDEQLDRHRLRVAAQKWNVLVLLAEEPVPESRVDMGCVNTELIGVYQTEQAVEAAKLEHLAHLVNDMYDNSADLERDERMEYALDCISEVEFTTCRREVRA